MSFWGKILMLVLGAILFNAISFHLMLEFGQDRLVENQLGWMKTNMEFTESNILHEIKEFSNDSVTIARISDTQEYIKSKNDYLKLTEQSEVHDSVEIIVAEEEFLEKIDEISSTFDSFINNRQAYLQLRFIDAQGIEQIRYERKAQHERAVRTPFENLQDKSDRDYFKESILLDEGEVHVSKIELNKEYGQVSIPETPVIRFSTPVFTKDREVAGVIVLNVFAEYLFESISEMVFEDVSLLNDKGGYIFSTIKPELAWTAFHEPVFPNDNFDSLSNLALKSDQFYVQKYKSVAHAYYRIPYSNIDSGLNMYLHIESPPQELFGEFIFTRTWLTIGIIISLSISGLLFLLILSFIGRQLKYVKETLENIDSGILDTNVPIVSGGQLGRIARQINRLIVNLHEKERELYEFITSASHQLRTPASALSMQIGLLKETATKESCSEELLNDIEDITEQNKRAVRVMNGLLKYLEIGQSYRPSNPTPISLRHLVDGILHSYNGLIEKKGLRLKISITKSLMIDVEKSFFRTVIDNLIHNAIVYTDEGDSITIQAKLLENDVIISVSDTGIGIPDAEQVRLFEKFFRASNAYAKDTVGSGMGLVNSQRIIEGHGGLLSITSKEGIGTKVEIRMPRKQND